MTAITQNLNSRTYTELELIEEISQINIHAPESYERIKNLLQLSSEYNYTFATIKAYTGLGYIYTQKSQYESARIAFSKALVFFEDIKESSVFTEEEKQRLQIQIEGGVGNTYAFQTSIDLALPHYYKALQIAEKLADAHQISNYLGNIGTIYVMNNDSNKALKYYMSAKDIKVKEKLFKHLDTLYSNIASCFLVQKKNKEASKYLKQALEVASKTKNKDAIGIIYTNYADLYTAEKQYEQALQYATEAILFREETSNLEGLMRAVISKGRILNAQGKYSESIKTLSKALEIAELSNSKEGRARSYELMAGTYKQMGNFEKSCAYLEKYILVNGEINNEKTQKTVADLNLRYESEKKDLEIKQLYQQQKLLSSKNEELKLFASKASHDMKEPLRMIGSFSHLLKRRYSNQLDNSAKEYLDIIENANQRMNQLLTDLLNYTLAGAHTKRKQPVDLNEVFLFVQQNLQLTIKEKEAIIETDYLPKVSAHQTDILQLFQNLVSNALKFCTQKIPHIQLKVKELKSMWEFSIRDNGIGISKKNQSRIFDIFTRLHSREEFEGTGIGLAICQKIIHQYKGDIWVESEEGKGTTFFFTLPM